MARKNTIPGFKIFNATSATTNQTSSTVNVLNLDKCSVHVKFSAANTGEFTVEARNRRDESDDAPWYQLDFGSDLTVTDETQVQIVLNSLPFTDFRVNWIPSAGSGTLTARVTAKTEGA